MAKKAKSIVPTRVMCCLIGPDVIIFVGIIMEVVVVEWIEFIARTLFEICRLYRFSR